MVVHVYSRTRKNIFSAKNTIFLKDISRTLSFKSVESPDTPVSYVHIILINCVYTLSIILTRLLRILYIFGYYIIIDNYINIILHTFVISLMYNCFIFFIGYIYIKLYQTNSYSRCVFLYTIAYIYWPLIYIIYCIIREMNYFIANIVYMNLISGIILYFLTINLGKGYDIRRDQRDLFSFLIINTVISLIILFSINIYLDKNM